ncbi:hypothetical protein [Leucobacter celer]|jgi:hypothetical protein|uniref:hypothetical protein n=1 Tax=Leucobacter celer TaxID=668625 RepID=UPI0006A7A5A3|nr:hypothetical protein [Leucobacter celer]
MTLVADLVMVGAGALCLGGAVASRRRFGIAASAVMLAAMADLAFLGLLPAPVWAAALLIAALLLGLGMRVESRRAGADLGGGSAAVRSGPGVPRAAMILSALAYPAAAWLALGHSGAGVGAGWGAGAGAGETGGVSGSSHAGHGADTMLVAPLLLTVALAAALVALCAAALRSRRRLLAAETGGMAAMLLVMLV